MRARDAKRVEQRQHVTRIDRQLIAHRIGAAPRPPPPADIDREHAPPRVREPRGQFLEIARIASEAVDADHRQARRAVGGGIIAGKERHPVGRMPAPLLEIRHDQNRYSAENRAVRGGP